MRLILALFSFLAIAATTATAQEYKCQNGGKVYLAQYPCPGYEFKESTAPPSYGRTPEPTKSAAQALAESPIVRQSNAMIAAALAERDFDKAERLAVTKEQWQMIDTAKRQARKEWSEAEGRAIERDAQETAKRVAYEQRRRAEANAAAAQAYAVAAKANAAEAQANAADRTAAQAAARNADAATRAAIQEGQRQMDAAVRETNRAGAEALRKVLER